jgi:hypothetical protein
MVPFFGKRRVGLGRLLWEGQTAALFNTA